MKFIKVWLKKRKNPQRQGGEKTVSYTLQWREGGRDRYLSLGPHATDEFAERRRAELEQQLNSRPAVPVVPAVATPGPDQGAGWPSDPARFIERFKAEYPADWALHVERHNDGEAGVIQLVTKWMAQETAERVRQALQNVAGRLRAKSSS